MTEYGEKYRVTRGIGVPGRIDILKEGLVDPKYTISDQHFNVVA